MVPARVRIGVRVRVRVRVGITVTVTVSVRVRCAPNPNSSPNSNPNQAQEARRLDKILGPGASRAALLTDALPLDEGDAALAGVSGDTLAPSALAPGQYKDYTAAGGFSTTTGRFTPQSLAGDNYWATKGIPNDRAGRQMNHYFNMDEWQEKMNARQGSSKKARYGW